MILIFRRRSPLAENQRAAWACVRAWLDVWAALWRP
jgi:hypothetical protein